MILRGVAVVRIFRSLAAPGRHHFAGWPPSADVFVVPLPTRANSDRPELLCRHDTQHPPVTVLPMWIDDHLVQQAKYFEIDLLCQEIMSNHFHPVLRSRRDVVAEWDDAEVARRWLVLCPAARDEHRQPIAPTEFELNQIRNNKEKLAEIRGRLGDNQEPAVELSAARKIHGEG